MREKAIKYANDILSGNIISCETIKQAARRFLDDLERDDLIFDDRLANMFEKFCASLKHSTNKYYGKPFILTPYQCFFCYQFYASKYKSTGEKRFKNVYYQIGRKNGKSSLVAAISLFELIINQNELVVVANTIQQAKINLKLTGDYAASIDPKQKYIVPQFSRIKYNNTTLTVRAADGRTLDGLNGSFIIDEFHEGKRETLDVLTSMINTGNRDNQFGIIITTAGLDLSKHCYSLYLNYKEQLKGNLPLNDRTLIIIYELDDDDYKIEKTSTEIIIPKWQTDFTLLEKANPNIDVTVNRQSLIEGIENTKIDTTTKKSFLTKNLNIWVDGVEIENHEKYIDDEIILKQMQDIDFNDFKNCWCFIGVDLSNHKDIASVTWLIIKDGIFYFKTFPYIPNFNDNTADFQSQCAVWKVHNYITITNGDITDINRIINDILNIKNEYKLEIIEVGLDRTYANIIMKEFENHDIDYRMCNQGALALTKPTKELIYLLHNEQAIIDKNSCVRFNFHNAILKEYDSKLCKVIKSTSSKKIDCVYSIIIALNTYLTSSYLGETN